MNRLRLWISWLVMPVNLGHFHRACFLRRVPWPLNTTCALLLSGQRLRCFGLHLVWAHCFSWYPWLLLFYVNCQGHPVCLRIFTGLFPFLRCCFARLTHVWSLGVVFWEIFHQAEPFGDQPNLNSDPRCKQSCLQIMFDIIGSSTFQLFSVNSLKCSRNGRSLCRQALKLPCSAFISRSFEPPLSLIQSFVKQRWSLYLNLWRYCRPNSCSKTGISWHCLQAFDPNKRPSAAEVSVSVLKMIDHENPEMFRYITSCV